jgi:hypothetical protein
MLPSDLLSRNESARPPEDLYIRRKKLQHRSSSDSSLLEVTIKSKPQVLATKVSATRQHGSSSLRPPKRHRPEPSESGTSKTSNGREETFEKRARYKTRQDRYEPKDKTRKPVNPNGHSRGKSKREKRGDRKKAAKKAGEELIEKFSSKSIGKHRLTVRSTRRMMCKLLITDRFGLLMALGFSRMVVHRCQPNVVAVSAPG